MQMNKRSAMALAAGLVAALLAGAVALSLGVAGPQPASAGGKHDPRVRTIERTVTVHRQAKQSAPRIVMLPGSNPALSGTQGWSGRSFEGDDGFESEGGFEGNSGSTNGTGGSSGSGEFGDD